MKLKISSFIGISSRKGEDDVIYIRKPISGSGKPFSVLGDFLAKLKLAFLRNLGLKIHIDTPSEGKFFSFETLPK